MGGGDGSGEAGGEGEWDGEAVGEADDDVANGFGGLEVTFYVRGIRGTSNLVHGGSVAPGELSVTARVKILMGVSVFRDRITSVSAQVATAI